MQDAPPATTTPQFTRLAMASLLLLGLAACGDGKPPRRIHERTDLSTPWEKARLVGIDEDAPLEGTPRWRKTVLTQLYDLPAGRVNFHARQFAVKPFSETEDVYIVEWRSNTENPDGTRAPDDIHCHTFLADRMPMQSDAWLFAGVYTDGFTPKFTLPAGFGIKVTRGIRSRFLPMFNNRRNTDRQARMRVEIDYLKGKAAEGIVALHAFTVSSERPDTYWVEPRESGAALYKDVRVRNVTIPATGRVHAIGAHLHPYGRSVELKRKRDGKVLFTAQMIEADNLEEQRLTTYNSAAGFYIQRGERYIVTTIYENYTDEKIDAMGGLFLFYDPAGGPDAKGEGPK